MGIQDVTFARENAKRYTWARDLVEDWKTSVEHAMAQDRSFFDEMISELTMWSMYGQNCPACVGRLSAMGETGLYEWDVTEPEKLVCKYCETEYPNVDYPETGSMTAPRMGQTFGFYLTEEERAYPEDRLGQYAFTWSRHPVHTSWSGIIRSQKTFWCTEQMDVLAKLYGVTGEAAYAERCAWILDILARRYPNWLFHSYDGSYADMPPGEVATEMGKNPPAGRFPIGTIINAFDRHNRDDHAVLFNGFWGAGRLGCSGSDGGSILRALLSHDLIREARATDGSPVITPEMDKRIREDLILAGCIDTENWDAINNKSGRGRALSGAVGITFDRPEGVRRAIEGLELLMEDAFHFDGFCTESPSYSDMHLSIMRSIPEVLCGYSDPEGYVPAEGDPLSDFDPFQAFDRYRLALESMVRMLDPRQEYPVIGDTHAGGGLQSIHAEILADRYGPRYAGLLERAQGAPLSEVGSEYALWHRDPDLAVQEEVDLPLCTEWFPGWHVAVLRGGPDLGRHTAFYLNGYAHGGHRHRDTLSAIYIAHGQEMASDRGYIWDDPRNAWTGSTLSHNLVTVDGENQNGEGCHSTLELFGRGPGVEVVQASANAYAQCDRYQRTCVLVEIPAGGSYAIDLFRVRGGKLHQYGFNCNGELTGIEGATLESTEDEIEWLANLRAAQPEGPFTATWSHAGEQMDLSVLGRIDRLVAADAPGWRSSNGDQLNAPPVQQLLAERRDERGAESQFAAIMSPHSEGERPVKGARLLLDDVKTGAMALAVEREGHTDYLLSSPEGTRCDAGPVSLTGGLGFVSVDADGKVTRAYLLGGTKLTCGDVSLDAPAGVTRLKVRSVEDRTFNVAGDVPSDIEGRYVLAGETGFEIESTTSASITVRDYPAIESEELRILNAAVYDNE